MRVDFAALTDVGRKRENNEDAWNADPAVGVYLVADGMGGHARGEVASRMASETVLEHIRGVGPGATKADLVSGIELANRRIHEVSNREDDHRGMGTTIVAVLTQEGRVALAHVGDSRAYLWRRDRLRQVTRDHTLVQQQIDEGKLRAEDAQSVVYRNVLTRAVGSAAELEIEHQLVRIKEDDRLLLCTDGLTAMAPDDVIQTILQRETDLETACVRLVEAANEAGGKDNVTVLLMRFTEVHSALEGIIDRVA